MSSITLQTEDLLMILNDEGFDSNKRMKYTMFCDAFRSSETKDSVILEWLTFLKDNIYLLEKNENFVAVLLQINWMKKEDSVIRLYSEFLLNLVSAHINHLTSVLRMILKIFSSGSVTNDSKSAVPEDNESFEYLHELLKNIIRIVPTTPRVLMQLLPEKFQYLKKNTDDNQNYLENLLLMTRYLPTYRQAILELILSRMLDIDVRTPKSEIEEMEFEDEEGGTVFPVDMDCELSQSEKNDDTKMKHPLADILDVYMDKLFSFIDDICESNSEVLNWEETVNLYKTLLALFDKLILPTYACVHVQFILFYICRLKWPLCEGFIKYLWKKVQNPSLSPIMRQMSACYIGSLLARAKYISINSVTFVLDAMTNWIHKYIEKQSVNKQPYVDTDIHGTFYVVCQMVFYIFAFRHKELIEMKNGLRYLQGLNFQRMVNCRLNPLKACLPSITTNFASVTRSYQLVYCYTIIERNNRCSIPVVIQTPDGLTHATNMKSLESFFPFDPYLLKRSGKKIQSIYRVFEKVKEEKSITEDDDFMFEDPSPSTPSILAQLELEAAPVFKEHVDAYR